MPAIPNRAFNIHTINLHRHAYLPPIIVRSNARPSMQTSPRPMTAQWIFLWRFIFLLISFSDSSLHVSALKIANQTRDMRANPPIERLARSHLLPIQSSPLPTVEECITDRFNFAQQKGCRCHLFQSNPNEYSKGVFKSPGYETIPRSKYDCLLYTFVGDLDEVVELRFKEANIEARIHENKCNDFVRVYKNLDRAELNLEDRPDHEMCGRLGDWPKKHFISRDRVLILELRLMSSAGDKDYGFLGEFFFRKKTDFKTTNDKQAPEETCYQEIHRKNYLQDVLPNKPSCRFNFISENPSDRVYLLIQSLKETSKVSTCRHYRDVLNLEMTSSQLVLNGTLNYFDIRAFGCLEVFSAKNRFSVEIKGLESVARVSYKFLPPIIVKHRSSKRFIDLDNIPVTGIIQTTTFPLGYERSFDQNFIIQYPKQGHLELTINKLDIGYIESVSELFCKSNYHDKVEISQDSQLVAVICQRYRNKYVVWLEKHPKTQFLYNSELKKFNFKSDNIAIKFIADNQKSSQEQGARFEYRFYSSLDTMEKDFSAPNPHSNSIADDCIFQVQASQRKDNLDRYRHSLRNKIGQNKTLTCRWEIYGKPGYRIKLKLVSNEHAQGQDRLNPKVNDKGSLNSLQGDEQPKYALSQRILRCPAEKSLKIYNFERSESDKNQIKSLELMTVCENLVYSRSEISSTSVLSSSIPRLDVETKADISSFDRKSFNQRFGYDIEFSLVKDFGVMTSNGHQIGDECSFEFYSTEKSTGHFTSPNYPGQYPNNIVCNYKFQGLSTQTVFITFREFNLEHNKVNCNDENGDYIEVRSCRDPNILLASRQCQLQTKENSIKFTSPESCVNLIFRANEKYIREGFLGHYQFLPDFYFSSNNARKSFLDIIVLICFLINQFFCF